jgi:hypothetical protein
MSARKSPASPHRIGFVADVHAGSKYAVVPPRFLPASAGPAGKFTTYVWDIWTDFVKRCPPLDALVLNGDILDGENPNKRAASNAVDDSPHKQVDMALEALGPLRDKTHKVWLVRGTVYHDSKYHEPIEILGRELRCEEWDERRYSGYVLEGEFCGVRLHATHAMSMGAIYGGTLADRTTLFAAAAENQAKTNPADLIVRSHTHRTFRGESHGKTFLQTRCWSLVTPYAIAKMEAYRAALLCDLGAHVLTLTPDGWCWKDYGYEPFKADIRKLA